MRTDLSTMPSSKHSCISCSVAFLVFFFFFSEILRTWLSTKLQQLDTKNWRPHYNSSPLPSTFARPQLCSQPCWCVRSAHRCPSSPSWSEAMPKPCPSHEVTVKQQLLMDLWWPVMTDDDLWWPMESYGSSGYQICWPRLFLSVMCQPPGLGKSRLPPGTPGRQSCGSRGGEHLPCSSVFLKP